MWKTSLKWMFLIIGTTIGAGYASGRELWQFFGSESVLAIFLFIFIFSLSCFIIMKISFEKKTIHFHPVLQTLVGKKLSYFYDIVIIIYLFTTTVVMLAGGKATLVAFHVPYRLGIGLFCLSPQVTFIFMSILLWTAIYTTAAAGVLGITTRFQLTLKLPLRNRQFVLTCCNPFISNCYTL